MVSLLVILTRPRLHFHAACAVRATNGMSLIRKFGPDRVKVKSLQTLGGHYGGLVSTYTGPTAN
jgi:hypothetical protein